MDIHKLWQAASQKLKVAIPSILLGCVLTYLFYDSMVLVGKNSEIASLNAAVEVEKGHQKVLDERVKLLGDKNSFLSERLKYKPQTEKDKNEENTALIEKLRKENTYLQSVKSKLELIEGDKVELAKLEVKLDDVISQNVTLKKELSKYESKIIVQSERLESGESWSGFSGEVTFGVSKIDRDYNDGNFAKATSSLFPEKGKRIQAGDRFEFKVNNESFYLVVSSVQYVGSYVEISVHKNITS